jgi:hypothetical protein
MKTPASEDTGVRLICNLTGQVPESVIGRHWAKPVNETTTTLEPDQALPAAFWAAV